MSFRKKSDSETDDESIDKKGNGCDDPKGADDSLGNSSIKVGKAGIEWAATSQIQSIEDRLGASTTIGGDSERGPEAYNYQKPEILNQESRSFRRKNRKRKHSGRNLSPATSDKSSISRTTTQADVQMAGGSKGFVVSTSKSSKPMEDKQFKYYEPNNYIPKRMMKRNYNKERLFNIEFDQNASELKIGKQIAHALGEKLPELIIKVVGLIGKEISIELFKKCQELEEKGGMMTSDGKRRRTPGGIFLDLFKSDERTSKEMKKEFNIFASATYQSRKKKPSSKEGSSTAKEEDWPKASEVFGSAISDEAIKSEV